MRYCKNETLQKFVEKLVKEIKFENNRRQPNGKPLNIPFLISVLCQAFNSYENTYSEFILDIENSSDYDIVIEETSNDYNGICKIIIYFYLGKDENDFDKEANFKYDLEFAYDEKYYGYCECRPNDRDYREDKGCCGHDCDWNAPEFEMRKSIFVANQSWIGDEHDYWNFEDEFYLDDKEENERKAREERGNKIKYLKKTIENAQKELKELENM